MWMKMARALQLSTHSNQQYGAAVVSKREKNTSAREVSTASILMYSPDSIGLGHMRRNSAIAEGLARELPGASSLLLVGSSAGVYFDLPPGSDCVKLPSILKTAKNQWQPKSLHVSNDVARRIRSGIITETALALKPDVFLVDHLPTGIWDELVPALKAVKSLPQRPRLVLGLRDILGAPEDIRAQWQAARLYDIIEEFYDSILIYGSPDIFATADHYGLSGRFADRIHYCGYVHAADAVRSHSVNSMNSGKPKVVMSAGGGHDAYPMMRFVLQAFEEQPETPNVDLLVVTGPLMPGHQRAEIAALAQAISAQCISSTPNLQAQMAGADALITMGGYNSIMEAIATGVPTIAIPRIGPSAEQRLRAKLFGALDLVRSIDLEEGSQEQLVKEVQAAIATPRRKTPALRFEGIPNAARAIASLVRINHLAEQENQQVMEAVA
jgi:predicted glycosyltransferase